ncbi:MAG: hypothetical protein IJ794_16540 [Lachnospiraceae bacterium]|nr:hypothetical protein [Lachnospiraceae bacterium]
MKQKARNSKTLLLLLLMVVSMIFAGCGKKSYATLEDFLNDNPAAKSSLNASMSSSDGTATVDVSGNTLIMKAYYNEKVWGVDPSVDAQLKTQMDAYFAGASVQKQLEQSINQVAEGSGIDASKLSARYEFYNPGDTTPSYTYTYPQQ